MDIWRNNVDAILQVTTRMCVYVYACVRIASTYILCVCVCVCVRARVYPP